MPKPNILNTYQSNFSLSNNYAVRLEIDWYPQFGALEVIDVVVAVEGDELLIFADGVQVASIPAHRADGVFLRNGREG